MKVLNLGTPQPKQLDFIRARTKHVAYGGARGGGKSWAVRTEAKGLAEKFPGIKILIVRRTYPELVNNHVNPLREELTSFARYSKSEKVFKFPNGSTIKMGYCKDDNSLLQYQGAEYDIIFLDEATQLREEWIQKITACCRGVNNFPKRIYYTCNPGGVSHGYIKRLFVDRVYRTNENPEDYTFIPAQVYDNKALMKAQPEYVDQLKALPPKLRKAWLEGSWDIFEGQFFEDFRPEVDTRAATEAGCLEEAEELRKARRWTHVISADDFRPKKYWPVYRSFDWGYHRPFSMGYYTVDDDGVAYRIAEFYGVQHAGHEALPNEGLKWPPEKVFSEIQRFEREHQFLAGREISGVADPAIWDAESGVSFAETAMKYGIYFRKGDNARIPGWMQCHYRLSFDENGYAMFYVLDTCREFIRTIPTLVYDENRPEDLDTEGEDHIADEWRYFCMSRPIKPKLEVAEYVPAYGSDPLNQYEDRRW